MSYSELVKENIEIVKTESYETKVSLERVVDTYLDKVLDFKKVISNIQKKIDDLAEYTSQGLDDKSVSKEEVQQVIPELKKLNLELTKFYIVVRDTKWFYGAAKDFVKDFHGSIDNLRETCSDLVLFRIELDNDDEYQKLCDKINSL